MKRNVSHVLVGILVLGLLTACGAQNSTTPSSNNTPSTESTQTTASQSLSFSDLSALLGKSDADVSKVLGEGTENVTADGSFLIGREYQSTVLDTKVKLYTTYANDEAHTVESLSLWITDGSSPVSDDTVSSWVDALTQHIGADPSITGPSEESGTRTWNWTTDDSIWNLQLLENILTLSIQAPLGGELQ